MLKPNSADLQLFTQTAQQKCTLLSGNDCRLCFVDQRSLRLRRQTSLSRTLRFAHPPDLQEHLQEDFRLEILREFKKFKNILYVFQNLVNLYTFFDNTVFEPKTIYYFRKPLRTNTNSVYHSETEDYPRPKIPISVEPPPVSHW